MRFSFILFCLIQVFHSQLPGQSMNDIITLVSKERVVQNMLEFSGEVPVVIDGLEVTIEHRVSHQDNNQAAEYLLGKLNLPNVLVSDITFGESGRNIIGIQLGTVNPDNIYILCAHYDSTNDHGADDNASGTIAVLEAAEILSNYTLENTIVYALWDEEEIGLLGSKDYAKDAAQNEDNILGVLNMDMMAYDSNNDHIFDIDVRDVEESYEIRDDLIQLYTSLNLNLNHTVVDPGTTASDHASFWGQGYSGVLLGEAWSVNDVTPGYHTDGDVWSLLNEEYYLEMIKLVVAFGALKGEASTSSSFEEIEKNIQFYPNPAQTFLNISNQNNIIDKYVFYDHLGRLIKSGNISSSDASVDISDLSDGSYFVQLKAGTKTVFQKVLIKEID